MNIRPEFSELARMDAECEKLAREICLETVCPLRDPGYLRVPPFLQNRPRPCGEDILLGRAGVLQ